MASFPSSYIKTEASSVTRNADLCSITGTNFSEWYRQEVGTVVCEADRTAISGQYHTILRLNNGGTFRHGLRYRNALNNQMQFLANVDDAGYSVANEVLATEVTRFGFALQTDNSAWSAQGVVGVHGLSATLSTVNSAYIGASPAGTGSLNGHIRKLQYWTRRLSNTELQALTRG